VTITRGVIGAFAALSAALAVEPRRTH